ncbi:MAG: hypothetical protein KatS3mg051_1708 [Anaerolineae bacterium]|nr:MAG: hypothetical protein KatS3mg051_1708 [Anaerolineae bacterium]
MPTASDHIHNHATVSGRAVTIRVRHLQEWPDAGEAVDALVDLAWDRLGIREGLSLEVERRGDVLILRAVRLSLARLLHDAGVRVG